MSDEFLQPRSLEPDGPRKAAGKTRSPKKGLPLLLLLVFGLALFVMYHFGQHREPVPVAAPTPTAAPEPTSTPDPALRLQAEAALEQVMDKWRQLRPAEPGRWAPEIWKTLEEKKNRADQLLAENKYPEATDMYPSLLPDLDRLLARLPALPEELYPRAFEAYTAGNKTDAVGWLQIILFVDPGHKQAAELLPRAQIADVSMDRLKKAQAFIAASQWDLAFAELNRLKQEDALFPGSAELRKTVTEELSRKEFSNWMTQALLALENGDLDSASELVERAAGFRPEDPQVKTLQQQVADRLLQKRVLELKTEAEVLAHKEQWREAHIVWLKMKELDPAAPWIQQGLESSLRWKLTDEKLSKGIEHPASDQTGAFLEEMQERAGWPAGLVRKAEALERLRKRAVTPVPVTLVSDGETTVQIARVARPEKFMRKELTLKPGSYVASGFRYGYRDVRVAFEVKPGPQNLSVTVICTEGL